MNGKQSKPKEKRCAFCGKPFAPYNSLDKFCCISCRVESQKSKRTRRWSQKSVERITGENNPAYRNGNFVRGAKRMSKGERIFIKNAREIKDAMIDDRGRVYCEYCGTSYSLRFEAHHIIFRSEKPLHEHLHDKENIYILCIKHHNDFHKQKGMRNNLVRERGLNLLFGDDVLDK